MATTAKRRATYEDLLEVPDHLVAEIINGKLVTSPRPGSTHARAAGTLGTKLGRPFDDGEDGPGGWILLPEPELHLDDQIVVPDMAGWRRERMPEMPDAAHFTLAPDWVCEVLSPQSTEARDREDKMPIYAHPQVRFLWLVNPTTQTLESYGLEWEKKKWLLLGTWGGNKKVRAKPFDAVELDLAALWSR